MSPARIGSVNIVFQKIDNTGHLLTDGSLLDDGKSVDEAMYVEMEYAFTDRLSVSAGLPYVFAKYIGPGPTPANLPVDQCKCWHSGLQDFGVTARYNIVNGALALTPSIAVGMPSHDYDYQGEAVLGRNLREMRLAIDAGQRLDAISPRFSLQERYSYAVVERVLGIPNNRSNATLQVGYSFTRKLSAHGQVSWQRTHGGLRFGSPSPDLLFPGEVGPPGGARFDQHDRLLRDNNWRGGGGVSYSLPRMDVFGSYIEYLKGTDSHAGRVFTAGISVPFELSR